MYVLSHLVGHVDDAQGEDQLLHTVGLRGDTLFVKVAGEVNVGTELTGEAEGLDKAVQHGVAPVVHRFAQLHRALRNAGPEGAVVVQGVGQLHPFVLFGLLQAFPKFVHKQHSLIYGNIW